MKRIEGYRSWLLAAGIAVVAVVLTFALDPWLGRNIPYGIFFLAVTITALYSGFVPALMATTLSALAACWLYLEPRHALWFAEFEDAASLALFIVLSIVISVLGYSVRKKLETAGRGLRRQAALIEERKQAARALRASEERFRAIFESSPDCILVWDRDYNYLYANQAAIDHVGTTRDNVIGKNIRDGLGHIPDFMHLWMERVDRAFASGESFRVEDVVPVGDRLVYSESQISPIRDAAGNIFAVGVVYRDVTERKQVEGALRQSELFYRQTLESIPGMVFTTRPDGYCDYQSQQWVDYTGVPMSEHLGDGWNKLLHPDDRPRAFAAWRAAVEGDAPYDLEYRVRRRDGEYEWFRVIGQPIHDAKGAVVRWFGVALNIEDLKRVEAALRKSEETLSAVLDSLPVGIVIAEANGRIVRTNKANDDLWANPPAETANWQQYGDWVGYWPETGERIKAEEWALARALRTGEVVTGDLVEVQQFGTGERRFSLNNAAAVRDAAGNIVAGVVAQLDVTDRILAERELRLNEAQFRAFFENASVGASELDTNSQLVMVNDRLCEILGYTREELVGRSPVELWHPDEREEGEKLIEQFFRGELPIYRSEKRYVRKDGQVIWVRTVAGLMRDENGEPWRSAAITEDITEAKKAEEALRQAVARYEQQVRLFEGVASTTPDFVYLFDRSGRFVYANRRLLEVWGMDIAEVFGKTCRELGYEQWHHDMHMREITQVIATKQPIRGEVPFKAPRTGIYGVYEYIFTPVLDSTGEVELIAGTTRDVSHRKHLEDELRAAQVSAERAKAEAEKANAAKDEFLGVLSHELRTPLSPVLAAIQLMQRGGELSEKGRQLAEIIRRNVELEARLIDDLLDLTRIARGKISLKMDRVNICTVLQRVSDICRPDIEAKRIHFGIDLRNGPHPVNGDAARLQQILWNLLNNSIKFTPEDGCVGIRSYRRNGEVITEVNDSGIGIDPQVLPVIFNAFEQGNRRITRQFGGLGLGLAITKRLVEIHGGTIVAESLGKDKGATFRVTLPVAEEAAKRIEEEKEHIRQEHEGSPCEILLVEDHRDTATMMKALLEDAGYTVYVAADVAQSLEATNERHFDLLISDLGLPDGSGLDLMAELQRKERRLKGIALSGFGREEDVRRSREAGFTEHLTKPVDLEVLLAAVERVI